MVRGHCYCREGEGEGEGTSSSLERVPQLTIKEHAQRLQVHSCQHHGDKNFMIRVYKALS